MADTIFVRYPKSTTIELNREPDTFEVIYNIVPPNVEVDNEWMAPLEHQYRLRRTGGFYIPAGYKHSVFFVRITKFPIYEIGIMGKAEYDK